MTVICRRLWSHTPDTERTTVFPSEASVTNGIVHRRDGVTPSSLTFRWTEWWAAKDNSQKPAGWRQQERSVVRPARCNCEGLSVWPWEKSFTAALHRSTNRPATFVWMWKCEWGPCVNTVHLMCRFEILNIKDSSSSSTELCSWAVMSCGGQKTFRLLQLKWQCSLWYYVSHWIDSWFRQ